MKLSNTNSLMRNLVRYSLMPMLAAFGLAAHAQENQTTEPSTTEPKTTEPKTTEPSTTEPSTTEPKATTEKSLTHRDIVFIKRAAEDNLQEIQLGKLGEEKAQNQQLKDFSKKLEQDHAQANTQLQTIAQKNNVQWPQQMSAKEQKEYNKLQNLSGAEFDKEFTTYLLRDHAHDMAFYEREANRTQNAELKQYAQNTAKTMQGRLQTNESLAKDVGVDQKTIAGILKRHPEATGAPGAPTGKEKGSSSSGGY